MFSSRKGSEKTLMKRRISRKLYIPFYVMVIILVGIIVWIKINNLSLDLLVLALIFLFMLIGFKLTELHRFNNLYEVSPIALNHISGLASKKVKKIDFFAISELGVEQTVWQRLFNYGDVIIHMFAESAPIKNINKPREFADFLEEMISERRKTVAKHNREEDI